MGPMLVVLFALLMPSYGANILAVFLVPIPSHHQVFRPLIEGLAANHTITLVTTLPLPKEIPNIRQIVLPSFLNQSEVKENFPKFLNNPILRLNAILQRMGGLMILEYASKEKSFRDLINSEEKFDLIVTEARNQEAIIALGHWFDAPVVDVVTTPNNLWTYWLHGNPHDTSYMVDAMVDFNDKMTFSERLANTALFLAGKVLWWFYYERQHEFYVEHLWPGGAPKQRPRLMEMIENRVALIIENGHFSLNPPYPHTPNFISVAGLHIRDPKPLPQELKKFMDEADDGIIFFTMGSHLPASTILGEKVKEELIKTFSKVKQRVLWKWDEDIHNAPSNVRVAQWFPQIDILAHNKTRLFITHAGFLSTTEAMYHGMPVVAIPIISDQPKNAKALETAGVGLRISFENFAGADLSDAINKVLNNPWYAHNAKKLSEIVRDRPEPPLKTALYWIEYVIRHKPADHLRPHVTKLSWFQASLLDVYATMGVFIILNFCFVLTFFKCMYKLFRKDCINKNKKNQ